MGVLRYLEENDYIITEIAGTSMGALIGSLIAMGLTSDQIYAKAQTLTSSDILDINRKSITIGGASIIEQMDKVIGNKNIEDFPIPFKAIATDLDSGTEVVFTGGPVLDAVRYSISVPGVFSLPDQHKPIVDGGIINNLPIDHVSGKHIIASSCRGYGGFEIQKEKKKILGVTLPTNALAQKSDILMRSLVVMMRRIEDYQVQSHPQTKLIRPYLGDISAYDIKVLDQAIQRGYDEAKKILG
ncbi:MAG: patatin-like phospholipase family protein [Candidatus Peribacteria bacterium]|nr:MAG: patatin-like phospholipase family protein [Candidatus Peribacteria bacterium]